MSQLVPADTIEQIVGARRHDVRHQGRAVSAMDRGISPSTWEGWRDKPVYLALSRAGDLIPVGIPPLSRWIGENEEEDG